MHFLKKPGIESSWLNFRTLYKLCRKEFMSQESEYLDVKM